MEYHKFSERELTEIMGRKVRAQDEPREFDRTETLLTYARSMPDKVHINYHQWTEDTWCEDWLEFEGVLGRREAHFWFIAGTLVERLQDSTATLSTPSILRKTRFFGDLDFGEAHQRLSAWHDAFDAQYRSNRFYTQVYLAKTLGVLFGTGEAIRLILDALPERWWTAFLPYVGEPVESGEERAELCNLLDARFASPRLDDMNTRALIARLAPLARHQDLCRMYLDFEIKMRRGIQPQTFPVLSALDDDEDFMHYVGKLKAEVNRKTIVLLLSRFGMDACDHIYKLVSKIRTAGAMEDLPHILGNIHSPRIVPTFLHMYGKPECSIEAQEWLVSEGEQATRGLIENVSHRRFGDTAIELLRTIAEGEGGEELIETCLEGQSDHIQQKVIDEVLEHEEIELPSLPKSEYPRWLADMALPKKPKGLPRFVSHKNLKPLLTAGFEYELGTDAIYGVLNEFKTITLDTHDKAFVEGLKDLAEFESLREFVWQLFIDWTRHGLPSAHSWCLDILGIFGDDEVVQRLMPYIDSWPGQRKNALAYRAMDALELIGTDSAMTMLSTLARNSKYKGVKTKAKNQIDKMARDRGIDARTLEDRFIDDLGLDENGSATFSYGEREFRLGFDADLKPIVKDQDGKVYKSLPRPRKTDDADQAARAKKAYKMLSTQAKDIIKVQTKRLEQAMVSGRRWKHKKWRPKWVEHPLLRHICARIIWAEFDEEYRVLQTFRVADDLTYANFADEEITLGDNALIGVLHPLEVPPQNRLQWSQTLADYELNGAFRQMDRKLYLARDYVDGPSRKEINDMRDVMIQPGFLRGHLNNRQWVKDRPDADGYIYCFNKTFDLVGQTARVVIGPGIYAPDYKRDRDQFVKMIVFREQGKHQPLALKDVDPIVYSEVCRDIRGMVESAARGK